MLVGKIFSWVKNNILSTILLIFVAFFLLGKIQNLFLGTLYNNYSTFDSFDYGDSIGSLGSPSLPSAQFSPLAPEYNGNNTKSVTQNQNARMVVTDSSVSLQVSDVTKSVNEITEEVSRVEGFVVNTSINRPEEAATAYITVRVPSDKLKDFLSFLRENSVKVVNENIRGTDITDQYTDIQARLDILNRNRERYLQIMESATTVDEILRVQTQIFNLQSQIDSLKGQSMLMEKTSQTSLVSINMSTDELSLPYAPDHAWRPAVIYKQAVRSLVGTLRGLGTMLIWLGVYTPLLVGTGIVFFIIRRSIKRRQLK